MVNQMMEGEAEMKRGTGDRKRQGKRKLMPRRMLTRREGGGGIEEGMQVSTSAQ